MKINKYDWITNEVLATYDSISEAMFENHVCYGTIYKQLTKPVLEINRGRDFYFGYSPAKRYIIEVYDNETRELLGRYTSIKQASERTGVSQNQIQWQVKQNKPFDNRKMGSTSLWFVKKLYE